MKTYARVDNGIVMELLKTGDDIKKMFNPALIWIDITSESPQPGYGWTCSNGTFAPPEDA